MGHGTFSLLDAYPFQWGWSFDPTTYSWSCDFANWASACNGSVSVPISERLFGQGVRAHFELHRQHEDGRSLAKLTHHGKRAELWRKPPRRAGASL